MAKRNSLKKKIKNLAMADIQVCVLPEETEGEGLPPFNKSLYCVTIDGEMLTTPMGNKIVHEDERAIRELAAELEMADRLDVTKISLYNLYSTQLDFVDNERQEFSEEFVGHTLLNDPVLRPCAGPEVVDQMKYLRIITGYFKKNELTYPDFPQIPLDNTWLSMLSAKGLEDFEKLVRFVHSRIKKLNNAERTVFITVAHAHNSPILGLLLATKQITPQEFSIVYLTSLAINSKVWGDTDRKKEQALHNACIQQAEVMLRYMDQFSSNPRSLHVFLCHSSEDKHIVKRLYDQLENERWIDPWLDEKKILPGQDWNLEIEKAMRTADNIIILLSNSSITKEGYVQKEIRRSVDIAEEKPEGTLFIIPLRLEPCEVPRRLSNYQWVDYYKDNAYNRLLLSLNTRAQVLGINTS